MSLVVPILLLLATAPLVVAIMRANELFVVRVERGRVGVVRGKIPQGLLNELADVIGRGKVADGVRLRGVSEDGRVQLYPEGELTDAQRQQLRNVVASWPVVRVRNG